MGAGAGALHPGKPPAGSHGRPAPGSPELQVDTSAKETEVVGSLKAFIFCSSTEIFSENSSPASKRIGEKVQ